MTGTYQDIVYMRRIKQGKVVRVARADTHKGLVLALYPTKNKDLFSAEAFKDMDDNSERKEIQRGKIKDDIWLRLLDGEKHEDITSDYEGDSYCKKGAGFQQVLKSRTFRIADDSEEN